MFLSSQHVEIVDSGQKHVSNIKVSVTSKLQEAKDEEVTDSINIGMMYFRRFTYSQATRSMSSYKK